jgi:hypothetical protein
VRFAYVTSLRVEGKQTHILCRPKILPTGTETARNKLLPLGNNVYSMDSTYASLSATPLIPLPFTSNGR